MLFFLILIFVFSLVALYYISEGVTLASLIKKFTFSPKTMDANLSKKRMATHKLEDLEDNIVDFVAFKEAQQK